MYPRLTANEWHETKLACWKIHFRGSRMKMTSKRLNKFWKRNIHVPIRTDDSWASRRVHEIEHQLFQAVFDTDYPIPTDRRGCYNCAYRLLYGDNEYCAAPSDPSWPYRFQATEEGFCWCDRWWDIRNKNEDIKGAITMYKARNRAAMNNTVWESVVGPINEL